MQAQGQAEDAQLQSINQVAYANYPAATQAQVAQDESTSTYGYQIAQLQNNDPSAVSPDSTNNAPGIGSVVSDVLILGAIGGALWLFFEFGGVQGLGSLTRKNKNYLWLILGGAALLGYLVYTQIKKTESDATSTASGIQSGLAALNPFSS